MSYLRSFSGILSRRLMLISQARHNSDAGQLGDLGGGAGRGGGGGGSIRDAGGAFGKMEAAHEGEYFYKKEREQMQKLREDLHDEITFHEEQIRRHKDAIERHKERMSKLINNHGKSGKKD